MAYQTHSPDQKGMVDSQHRLKRLKLPEDMTSKSFLDIGCNEGFYCNIVAERGANRVLGIDHHAPALSIAEELYGDHQVIEFRHQGWQRLPDEQFDVVLWSSAMHYELDPLHVLRQVAERLKPGGLFILECGAVHDQSFEMVRIQRHDGTLWYPSIRFLEEQLLEPFCFRRDAPPELIGTDPAPRSVYHCRRRLTTVLLLRGKHHDGKSSTARTLQTTATKLIALDVYIYRMMTAKHQHSPLDSFIFQNKRSWNLTELYEAIDQEGLTDEYAEQLARGIAATDRVVIIEGYMTDKQAEALKSILKNRAKVWDAACE